MPGGGRTEIASKVKAQLGATRQVRGEGRIKNRAHSGMMFIKWLWHRQSHDRYDF